MAQRSSIDRLPPEVRGLVDRAIADNATIDEIIGLLLDQRDQGKLDETPSRSAVGRYSQQYRALAARQRDLSSVAKAFAGDFATEDDLQGRLMVQLVTSLITRVAMAEAEGEEVELDVKELHFLARAVKDAASAAKIDVDLKAKIRDEAKKEADLEARKKLDAAGRRGDLDPQALERAKRILGFE